MTASFWPSRSFLTRLYSFVFSIIWVKRQDSCSLYLPTVKYCVLKELETFIFNAYFSTPWAALNPNDDGQFINPLKNKRCLMYSHKFNNMCLETHQSYFKTMFLFSFLFLGPCTYPVVYVLLFLRVLGSHFPCPSYRGSSESFHIFSLFLAITSMR